MAEGITVEFLLEFNERYQRNNKKTGQKNLRCFPQCGKLGHMTYGFCGLPVVCKLHGIKSPNITIRAWGEFVLRGADEEWETNSLHDIADWKNKERSRKNPCFPFLRGDVTADNRSSSGGKESEMTIYFNQELLGWHYQWVATKHTCDSYHCFKVHVFSVENGSSKMTYLGSGLSPQFQLYSRRRQRGAKAAAKKDIKKTEQKQVKVVGEKRERNLFGNFTNDVDDQTATAILLNDSSGNQLAQGKLPNLLQHTQSHMAFSNQLGLLMQQQQQQQQNKSIHQQLFASFQAQALRNNQALPGGVNQQSSVNLCNFFDTQNNNLSMDVSVFTQIQARAQLQNSQVNNSNDGSNSIMLTSGINPSLQNKRQKLAPSAASDFSNLGLPSDSVANPNSFMTRGGKTFDEMKANSLTMSRLLLFLIHYSGGGNVSNFDRMGSKETEIENGVKSGDDGFTFLQDFFGGSNFKPETDASSLDIKGVDKSDNHATKLLNSMTGLSQEKAKTPVQLLKQAIMERGSETAKRNMDHIFEQIEAFSAFILAEKELSKDFTDYFSKWATSEGLVKLMKEMKEEDRLQLVNPMVDLDAVWYAQSITNLENGTEGKTAFAQLRLIIFKHVTRFLLSRNLQPEYFAEVMEIAAKSKILPVDPFVPPSRLAACYVHLQVYGDIESMKTQDFGSVKGVFENTEQQRIWQRAIFIIKRRLVRLSIINRVKQEYQMKKNQVTTRTPVHKSIEVSGTWVRDDSMGLPPMGIISEILQKITGIPVGQFLGKMMLQIFSCVKVDISKEVVNVQGTKKLLTNGSMSLKLDGQAHEWTPPQPMPFRPALRERKYACWIHVDGNGIHCVRFTAGGHFGSSKMGLMRFIDFRKVISDKAMKKFEDLTAATKKIEARIAAQAYMSPDGLSISLRISVFFFGDSDNAPQLGKEMEDYFKDSEEEIEQMRFHYFTKTQRFFRKLDDNDRVEELLRLIEE